MTSPSADQVPRPSISVIWIDNKQFVSLALGCGVNRQVYQVRLLMASDGVKSEEKVLQLPAEQLLRAAFYYELNEQYLDENQYHALIDRRALDEHLDPVFRQLLANESIVLGWALFEKNILSTSRLHVLRRTILDTRAEFINPKLVDSHIDKRCAGLPYIYPGFNTWKFCVQFNSMVLKDSDGVFRRILDGARLPEGSRAPWTTFSARSGALEIKAKELGLGAFLTKTPPSGKLLGFHTTKNGTVVPDAQILSAKLDHFDFHQRYSGETAKKRQEALEQVANDPTAPVPSTTQKKKRSLSAAKSTIPKSAGATQRTKVIVEPMAATAATESTAATASTAGASVVPTAPIQVDAEFWPEQVKYDLADDVMTMDELNRVLPKKRRRTTSSQPPQCALENRWMDAAVTKHTTDLLAGDETAEFSGESLPRLYSQECWFAWRLCLTMTRDFSETIACDIIDDKTDPRYIQWCKKIIDGIEACLPLHISSANAEPLETDDALQSMCDDAAKEITETYRLMSDGYIDPLVLRRRCKDFLKALTVAMEYYKLEEPVPGDDND
jgi:hypothetical protein